MTVIAILINECLVINEASPNFQTIEPPGDIADFNTPGRLLARKMPDLRNMAPSLLQSPPEHITIGATSSVPSVHESDMYKINRQAVIASHEYDFQLILL